MNQLNCKRQMILTIGKVKMHFVSLASNFTQLNEIFNVHELEQLKLTTMKILVYSKWQKIDIYRNCQEKYCFT